MSPSTKSVVGHAADPSSPVEPESKQHTSTARTWIIAVVVLVCLGIGFGSGLIYSSARGRSGTEQRRILYYHDPMHPSYRSDKPGIAPDCGMALEPVYADSGPQSASTSASGSSVRTPDIVQAVGIVAEEAQKSEFARTIRTTGRVGQDETRIHRVVAGTEGWVRSVMSKPAGTSVSKGDLLGVYYGRDLILQSAQQSLVYAVRSLDKASAEAGGKVPPAAQAQVDAAVENLLALGLPEIQIEALRKSGEPTKYIELRAPASGLVIANNVTSGMRFERGAELVQLADIAEVWITADLFRNESALLKPGKAAKVVLPNQSVSLTARVSDALPLFDATAQTTRVRMQAHNPGYVLRPGMFVDVEFPIQLPATLHLPVDSVVTSGTRKSVFVETEPGKYSRRNVETGWQFGDRVEILSGVVPGERVVRSGVFLLDSESRMNGAGANPAAALEPSHTSATPVTDPVCGMKTSATEHVVRYHGHEFRFCSESCKRRFEADPRKYASASPPL